MAGFLHPNLALIFGLETWRGVPVLVVEYLAGGSLAKRLGDGHAVAPALKLGIALAAALSAMHDQELLHRDVKPSNIGFAADGTPKLLDFGLSRLVEEGRMEPQSPAAGGPAESGSGARITHTGHLVGTPIYMSPEALRGAPPSPAQDLWALHLVIWEALVARHPCAGLSLEAAIRRLSSGELPDLRSVRPDFPPAVASLLARGLDPVPRHRLQTAEAVHDSFAEALGELGERVRNR